MDESIKCECGNDKFWWFDGFIRCPKCFNEYRIEFDYDFNPENWMRRFNKEENRYDENWEHFNPETFQQISDKGLESLSKDDSIVENAVRHQTGLYGVDYTGNHSGIKGKESHIVDNAVKVNGLTDVLERQGMSIVISPNVPSKKSIPTDALFEMAIQNKDARWMYNYQGNISYALENLQELGDTDWHWLKFWEDSGLRLIRG